MRLIKMECPYCSGHLEAKEGDTEVTCPYCGKISHVDAGIEKKETTINIRDEAKIKRAELEDRKHREQLQKEEAEKIEQFKHGKTGKFMIGFMVVCALGMLSAFTNHKILAGVIALIQIVILGVSWLISTGHIQTIKGVKVPPFVMTLIACVLVVPYMMLMSTQTYEKYVWPETEIASRLPKPASSYGRIVLSTSDTFKIVVEKTKENDYRNYLSACKKTFNNDVNEQDAYEAYDTDGYYLNLEYDRQESRMVIQAEAPIQMNELKWPINELSQQLPQPPSNHGIIEEESSEHLEILIGNVNKDAYRSYVDAVLEAGFQIDYRRDETDFRGNNEAGYSVQIDDNGRNTMHITLRAPREETPEPETTEVPEETVEPEEPEPTAEPTTEPTPEAEKAPASGIRPEFRKTMEEYEAFYDQYIDFMIKYQNSDNSMAMMTDYLSLMGKLAEWEAAIDKIDEKELSTEEALLFNEVNLRIATKLNKAALTMN